MMPLPQYYVNNRHYGLNLLHYQDVPPNGGVLQMPDAWSTLLAPIPPQTRAGEQGHGWSIDGVDLMTYIELPVGDDPRKLFPDGDASYPSAYYDLTSLSISRTTHNVRKIYLVIDDETLLENRRHWVVLTDSGDKDVPTHCFVMEERHRMWIRLYPGDRIASAGYLLDVIANQIGIGNIRYELLNRSGPVHTYEDQAGWMAKKAIDSGMWPGPI